MTRVTCTGMTKQGVQCKRFAREGQNTCSTHAVASQQCPICLSDMTSSSRTLECGHAFHVRCLERWKRTSRTCPMCRVPFDQPQYKVRVSIQRMADNHVMSDSYTTSNVQNIVNQFGMDPFIDPRFMTEILFEITSDEMITEVFRELGIRMPTRPFVPAATPPSQPHT